MKDDDLFQETSMSFGDHLEELRKCLFASIYAIAIGTCLGFCVGHKVVQYIQIPVEKSLQNYTNQQSVRKLEADAEELVKEGYSKDIVNVLKKYQIVHEERWIFPGELERILNREKEQKEQSGKTGQIPSLTGVDNLAERKDELQKKRAEVGFVYDTVHIDEAPIRLLLFAKSSEHAKTKALGVYEAFKIYIIASLIVGIVLASPFVAYYVWSFIAAGLYPHEKKYVYYFIPVSISLFFVGSLFAFFFVFRYVLDFLFGFNALLNIEPDPRITEWIGFALLLPVGFGISFQLPVVMFVLERVGIFTVKQYTEKWRLAVLVIFVIALLLTPGDPGSMLLMAFPLTILYFGGVLVCKLLPRKPGLFDAGEAE
ncbi:Sec-independent protein translocase protein TatC [Planctomycetales bacterium]|nr:Sec-independent protein translocase protein TatC [Planctomycetales bacterium]